MSSSAVKRVADDFSVIGLYGQIRLVTAFVTYNLLIVLACSKLCPEPGENNSWTQVLIINQAPAEQD